MFPWERANKITKNLFVHTFNVVKFFDMGTLIINVIYNTDRRPILPPQTCRWQ